MASNFPSATATPRELPMRGNSESQSSSPVYCTKDVSVTALMSDLAAHRRVAVECREAAIHAILDGCLEDRALLNTVCVSKTPPLVLILPNKSGQSARFKVRLSPEKHRISFTLALISA